MNPDPEVFQLKEKLRTTSEQLEKTRKAKKGVLGLAVGLSLLLLLVLGLIYKNRVLDYAQIDNVKIEQDGTSDRVIFHFDVIKDGRLDFHYGRAVLVDERTVQTGSKFTWSWGGVGETRVAVRSRQTLVPQWHQQIFNFPRRTEGTE